ncbi:hypothetical protein HanPSC8_Chr03g0084071 [Helianthus annuus]|nr:hypothetical protein HanLR1_Chr03g0077751 [Helianthus annuus]KAJ0941776.1 hypothetical protein HanPSC8_Chr03g0084071 [Helianthus annuus]
MSYTGGFYSFNSRTDGVNPYSTNPPKSLHDWKQKFFYIHRGVIPINMHYRGENEGVPRVNVSIDFAEQEWYKVFTRKVTSIAQLKERALVAAGMNMLWAPQNPTGVPIYGYQGKGYSLLNVLDPKAGGAMVMAILPEGRPMWLDQIRDCFLHPTNERLATYANAILGEDGGDDLDDVLSPTREEVIVLSSEGSDISHEGLIPRSPCAGPPQGTVNEPVNEPAGDDVETPVDTAEQLETRKKKKVDKSEGKKAEEPAAKAPRKRLSNSSFLDYVAAAALAEKKSRSQKETPVVPSKSEVDLGVYSAKPGNLLEKIYKSASGSRGKGARKVVISKITPPTSPPSRAFDLSPPHVDPGEKRKEYDVEVEQVGEGGFAGAGGGDGRGGGVDTEVESSEATPCHTIYTKRVQSSGEGGASVTHHSPEYEHVRSGSLDTHNPACADLPHAPRWNLTQGSRMTDLNNCREFFSLSLPRAERLFQKRRNRMDLLDDHIHAGVNFYATSQEIAREWQLIGEDTLEFEAAKKALAEEREKFNAEKKGLAWRVANAEDKLAKEKQFNANKQKEWEIVCERTDREMQTQRDTIVRLSGEKTRISEEVEQERASHQKRESEYLQRISKLQQLVTERSVKVRASEIIAEEANADSKWLLARGVPLIADRIVKSEELAKYMFELGEAPYDNGRKDGYGEARSAAEAKEALKNFDLYKTNCAARYAEKRQEYEFLEFAIVKAVGKLSRKADGVGLLKKALGDETPEAGGAGSGHQG